MVRIEGVAFGEESKDALCAILAASSKCREIQW